MCSRKLRRGLKKVGRVKSCNFPTESREFPTEDIMSNHNFNFGLWFIVYGLSPKWGFLTPTFFLSKGQFPDRLTFRGGGFIPPLPLPRGHEVRRDHFTAALCSNYPPANYHDSHKHLRLQILVNSSGSADQEVNLRKPCLWTRRSIYLERSAEHS